MEYDYSDYSEGMLDAEIEEAETDLVNIQAVKDQTGEAARRALIEKLGYLLTPAEVESAVDLVNNALDEALLDYKVKAQDQADAAEGESEAREEAINIRMYHAAVL